MLYKIIKINKKNIFIPEMDTKLFSVLFNIGLKSLFYGYLLYINKTGRNSSDISNLFLLLGIKEGFKKIDGFYYNIIIYPPILLINQ